MLVRDRATRNSLFSDGAGGVERIRDKGLPLIFHRVGKNSNNLGITAWTCVPIGETASQGGLSSTSQFRSNSMETTELLLDGKPARTVPSPSLQGTSPQSHSASRVTRFYGAPAARRFGRGNQASLSVFA